MLKMYNASFTGPDGTDLGHQSFMAGGMCDASDLAIIFGRQLNAQEIIFGPVREDWQIVLAKAPS